MSDLQMIWNWQPALYLFLGGLGAGAFIVATMLYMRGRVAYKHTITMTLWASTLSLIVGLILLLTELTSPLRGLLLWQSFSNLTSWMALGAWIVFVALIVFLAAAVLSSDKFYEIIGQREQPSWVLLKVRGALMYIGAVCGICVAAYTGILLFAAPGIPLWNTPLIPVLFTTSALATGVALVELLMKANAAKDTISNSIHTLFRRIVLVLIGIELVVAAAILITQPADILISGTLAPFFWILFVGCGLIVPAVVALLGLKKQSEGNGYHSDSLTSLGAISELVGGCTLRFLILMAGLHIDYVAKTVMQMFG
jgi:formate-dependent nitrite reductase membrane component NrfD